MERASPRTALPCRPRCPGPARGSINAQAGAGQGRHQGVRTSFRSSSAREPADLRAMADGGRVGVHGQSAGRGRKAYSGVGAQPRRRTARYRCAKRGGSRGRTWAAGRYREVGCDLHAAATRSRTTYAPCQRRALTAWAAQSVRKQAEGEVALPATAGTGGRCQSQWYAPQRNTGAYAGLWSALGALAASLTSSAAP